MLIKSVIRATAGVAIFIAATSAAQADVYTTTSPTAFVTLGGNTSVGSVSDQVNWALFDDQLHQPHDNGTVQNGNTEPTPGGDATTVHSGGGDALTTFVEGGANWQGNFGNGVTVLFTADNTITLSFAVPLIGLGIDAQIADVGPYKETLTAYSKLCTDLTGATCTTAATGYLGTISNSGTSAGTGPNGVSGGGIGGTGSEGTVPFVGLSTDAQDNPTSLANAGISFVTISVAGTNGDGFAIDTSVLFHYPINPNNNNTQATPEPGTLGLLGAGLAGLGFLRRRHRKA